MRWERRILWVSSCHPALSGCGKAVKDFDVQPDRPGDPEAARFCPRCHSLYLVKVERCPDCHGEIFKDFPGGH